jgi:urease alpha subunit
LISRIIWGEKEGNRSGIDNTNFAGLARETMPEQILHKLREVEVALSQSETVARAVRQIAVAEQTYYRWRREYGGLSIDQARKLKKLELENARLKRAVADLTLDKLILKEAAEGNF